jgi:hypothetical protein
LSEPPSVAVEAELFASVDVVEAALVVSDDVVEAALVFSDEVVAAAELDVVVSPIGSQSSYSVGVLCLFRPFSVLARRADADGAENSDFDRLREVLK